MKGVYFDVITRMIGLQAEADKVVAESEKAGAKAGKAWSGMFSKETASATAKSVESMKAQVNSGVSALEGASARAVKAHDSAADAAGRVRIAEAQLNAARGKYSEDSVQYIRAEEALAKAKRATATASGVAESAALAENKAVDDLAAKQAALTARQQEAAKSSGMLGTALKGAATIGVGALVYVLGEAISKGAEFDQKMTLIQTSAGEQSSNIAMLKSQVLGLSSQWGDSATESEDALLRIERAGYHGTDAIKVLSAAMQQAKSENAPLVEVSDQLTTSMKDFGVQVKDVNSAASINVATMANFKGTMEDFASSVGSVEETAHLAGMSMTGLYAALDEMTQHGFTAQRATDDLNHAIQKLATGGTAGMRDELGQLGISVDDLQKQLADPKVGLAGAMENISTAIMNKMGPSGRVMLDTFNQSKQAATDAGQMLAGMDQQAQEVAQTYMQSGGNLHKMSQNLSGADQGRLAQWSEQYKKSTGFNNMLKSGNQDAQTYKQALNAALGDSTTVAVAQNLTGAENFGAYQQTKAFLDAEGHTDANGDVKGADQANATLKNRIGVLKSTVGNTLTGFGDSQQGAAMTTVNGLISTIDWLDKHKGVLDTILTVSGTIGTMWASWKISAGITQGITALKAGMTALLPATEAETVAAGEMDVAMDANPIGAVVVAVEALIGGAILLYTHWNDVTEAWNWAYKNVFTPVGHWFQHVWSDDIVPPFKTGAEDIGKWFKSMGDDVHAVWVDIVHGVAWTVDKIADAFDALPSAIHIPGTNISTPDFKAMGRELHAFANAGMDYKRDGGEVTHPGYGLFRGQGGPRDDANLVAISDHEWVVDADGTARNRGVLERIKRGEKILARADGGLVGDDSTLSADPTSASATSSSSTASALSGLQLALAAIRKHIATMYEWGGGNLSTGVDCSGLVGDAQLLATGQQPDHRLGTTDTLLGGGWPGMIKGATSSDYFVAGVNDHHMVASILGQNIEARQSGEHIRMGSDAASPFDGQFIAQYHLDPTLIQPPYQPGASGDPTATGGNFTGLSTGTGTTASDKAAKYRAAAQKELDLAKKHDADAQKYMDEATHYKDGLPAAKAKHLDAMKRYLDEATKADALAAKSTGAAKQRHADAAAHDRELAQKAQDAAGKVGGGAQKYLDEATKARQEAADERKRAQEDLAKANQAMTSTGTKGKKSTSSLDTNGGWMTLKQFNEHLADVATDFITDSTGMPSWMSDPNQSAVLRIGKQLTNIRPKGNAWGAPNFSASPFLPPAQTQTQNQNQNQDLSDLLPATHDLGGPIPPGLSLVNNRTGHDEVLVINPALMGQRHPEPVAAGRGRGDGGSGPALLIQNYHAATDSQAEANRLGRTVNQYMRNR